MDINNQDTNSSYSQLSKAGEAARQFGELLSQQEWAVLGVGFNDLQTLREHYGSAWYEEILELSAQLLFAARDNWGTPQDLLATLTRDTFLMITQAANAVSMAQELKQEFKREILARIPAEDLSDQIVCPSPSAHWPLPSLAVGVVLAQDGPFSTPRDLLNKVNEVRSQNERLALQYVLSSLTFTQSQLQEAIQVADYSEKLYWEIERFAEVTTGPIHDLRNGLGILYEDARNMANLLADTVQSTELLTAVRYSRFLLETCSEIRFRGGSNPVKTDLARLLENSLSEWVQRLGPQIRVEAPTEVNVYVDSGQLELLLFNYIRRQQGRRGEGEILISCHDAGEHGELIIAGDGNADSVATDTESAHQSLLEQGLAELESEHSPWLYVFEKLMNRCGGEVQLHSEKTVLNFPTFDWQNVQSAEVIAKRNHYLRITIDQLRTNLAAALSKQVETNEAYNLEQIISLGDQLIVDLANEFNWIRTEAEVQGQKADELQKPLWQSIEAGSHFCQLLAANLTTLESELIPSIQATDIGEVLESVRQMLRSKINNIAELEWRVAPNLPPVSATETALAQVVLNLALNALEELAQSQPEVSRLGVAAFQTDETITIEVSDNGGGLPDEVTKLLFSEEISTRHHIEGGIGLKVVKSILDALDGEIKIQSGAEGTAISVSFPIWKDIQ